MPSPGRSAFAASSPTSYNKSGGVRNAACGRRRTVLTAWTGAEQLPGEQVFQVMAPSRHTLGLKGTASLAQSWLSVDSRSYFILCVVTAFTARFVTRLRSPTLLLWAPCPSHLWRARREQLTWLCIIQSLPIGEETTSSGCNNCDGEMLHIHEARWRTVNAASPTLLPNCNGWMM